MNFTIGQKVIYTYKNQVGTITGRTRGNRWEVRFSEVSSSFLPEDKLETVTESDDMVTCFGNGRFRGIDDLKRIIYRYRLSGELTNIIYSMSNSATQFMPHQFIPVTKYLESYTERLLIADEVGLGKTIESMYIWEELRARKNAQRLLIVVPAMLREKWKNDLQHYFSINAAIVSAKANQAGDSLADYIQRAVKAPEKESFVLIVSLEGIRAADSVYELLERYVDEEKVFDLVIIDEAHYLRNSATKSFRIGTLLRDVSEGALLLSATPIQTGSDNFYNLLHLLSEEDFYDKNQFESQLEANFPLVQLTSAIDENRSLDTVAGCLAEVLAGKSYHNDRFFDALKSELPQIMSSTERRVETVQQLKNRYFYDKYVTRTRKRDVIENRTERKVSAINYHLSGIEKAFYDDVTEYLKSQGDRTNVFNNFKLITRQRQMASCMPAALKAWQEKGYISSADDDETDDALLLDMSLDRETKGASFQMPSFDGYDYEILKRADTKFNSVLKIIEEILLRNPQEKIVIFSFFRGTVDYLYNRLTEAGIRTAFIRGGMRDDKNEAIRGFREADISVLVSTEVGSEGIDLQFAKYEINYDLPWNPMRLEQRIGRIDRIGQASPFIYILNSFCQDTIEDRILMRLYERIQIFKDSIGDLEEILGEKIQELQIDIFLHDYQTDEDIERQAEQVEYAIKNKQLMNRNLEIKSGMLSAYQKFVLDNIVEARNHYRMITAGELIFTIRDYLNNYYPGSVVEPTKNADCAKVLLSAEARRSLSRYVESTSNSGHTRLENDGAGVLCVFSTKAQEEFEPKKFKERVDINHPLVKWILNQIKSSAVDTTGCSLLSIARSQLHDAIRLEPGLYTYYIQKWNADGIRRLDELQYFVLRNGTDTPIEGMEAESILTAVVLDGRSYDVNLLNDDDFYSSCDSLQMLLDYALEVFSSFERKQVEHNQSMILEQEAYIERTFDTKIQNTKGILDRLQLEGKTEQVLRMWRGKLAHIKEEKENRIQRLHEKLECEVNFSDVAVGVLIVRGE